ncbi:HNH endonuclease [Rhodococcus sp. KBS0724]|uniref:HNH endonuclease n=1 Tax=Rhodococcus sp. KBS0724 TaxID=1179674 RepID=UPI00110DFAD7|nr:HNH endonuclease [Rhodococcus sp. KBS0724]TSD40505.1 HNH endonuclease [Rhodococcus sp. KBS0724]
MTAWVLVISKDYPDHWDFAQQDGFWDTRPRTKIEPGDDIFFWMSETGLIGWARATSATFKLNATHPPAHWHDVATGNYRWRFTLQTQSSTPLQTPRWKELAAATGITVPASNGRIEVKDPAGQTYLRALFKQLLEPDQPLPGGPRTYQPGDDLRTFAQRDVAQRRGQAQFRDSLIDAYNGSCAITGSTVLTVLEAAHIDRYHGDHTNHVNNGLLLRSDLHTLFDFQRITVDENLHVRVAPALLETEYGSHNGMPLKLPADPNHHPDRDALRRHRESCSWAVPEPTKN